MITKTLLSTLAVVAGLVVAVPGSAAGGHDAAWASSADGFAGAAGTTGGAGGTTVTATNQADLERYAKASAPHVIRVDRAITITPLGREIPVTSNKTVIGVGTRGEIVGGGFFLGAGTSNVIIRNLTVRDTRVASDDPDDKDFDYDGIQLDTANRVWIDHNWIHSTNSRNPSTDNVAYAHLYNNYLQNVRGYGNYSRGNTKMVLENSYFDGVKDPYYKDTTAQLRQSGSVVVNSSGKQQTGGSAFNPADFYPYALDRAADVPGLVRAQAGPRADIGL
ncbi:hypothetical protein [Saccharothrix sp. HUAS TT1]|uniref:pectate lyase family protein n=1 Tax=unclassified Saccharothrix TaxID=2593673 RepID=UPI00345C5AB7